MTVRSKVFSIAALVLALVSSFQACSKSRFSSDGSSVRMQGNGDFYSGKPTYYLNFDQTCSQLTAAGKPFPSAQIFLVGGSYQLVRANCQDVTPPQVLPSSEVLPGSAADEVLYQGRIYRQQADLSEYMTTPQVCPAGRTVVSANPLNLVTDALSMTQGWNNHPIEVTLEGSLSALPLFRFRRSDPNGLQPWHRVSQNVTIASNTLYSFSFVLKPGNATMGNVDYFMQGTGGPATDQYFKADLDLTNGSAVVTQNTPGITNVSVVSQPYGAGWAFTVFFNPGTVVNVADLGVSTASAGTIQLGDYVYGTAPRLHTVSSYCSP